MDLNNTPTHKISQFWHYIEILAYKINLLAILYENSIGREYTKEAKKFNLSNAKNILHVGCGSYPISGIMLKKNKASKIVTIDTNTKSVRRAGKLLKKKKLNKSIKADIGDGRNYPLNKFDTIILSGCAFPKKEVVEYIIKNANHNCKIIIRDANHEYYTTLDLIKKFKDIKKLDEIENKALFFKWKSLYLIKNY
jgi:protein-L-isoaspartate O-methyltransferase